MDESPANSPERSAVNIDGHLVHAQEKDVTAIQKEYGGVEGLAKALRSNITEGIDSTATGGTSVESRQAAYGFNRCEPCGPVQPHVSAVLPWLSHLHSINEKFLSISLAALECCKGFISLHFSEQVQSGAAQVLLCAVDWQPEGPDAHPADGSSHGKAQHGQNISCRLCTSSFLQMLLLLSKVACTMPADFNHTRCGGEGSAGRECVVRGCGHLGGSHCRERSGCAVFHLLASNGKLVKWSTA
jgi:hypothetical protein